MSTYFNSTNESGKGLKKSVAKAKSQDERIHNFFKVHPLGMFTPYEVCYFVFQDSVPVTSVRRSISNLTEKGLLRKTTTQKVGKWGKFNYTWRLNK